MLDSSHQLTDSEEETLVEQGRRIRALHEIISRPDLSFDEQIDATLRLGCQLLGTEIGKVGRQDLETNTSEFLNTVVLSDLNVKRGLKLPLDKTFCQVTFSTPEAIVISHVAESEYQNHPAAAFLGVQSYIGCSINVHGKKFGTVNFSNRKPVKKPFTEADKDLVNLIGSWVSVMMERQLEAEELKKSKEAADSANQAKSSFLANMSHEIRTPLTSIIGYAESALDADQSMEQMVMALRSIRMSSDHLLNLINDLLDFSKIEAGNLDIEKITTHPLQVISEVESIIVGQANKKSLEFSVDYNFPLPASIISDPLRLKQILLNICSNAIKFTHTGSVRIAINYLQDEDTLSFIIKDTGIGMSAEHLQNIFKPFKQADSSVSRRFGGTGLGLSLSKRLADLMNGELLVNSEHGVGSEFTLKLFQTQAGRNPPSLIESMQEVRTSQDPNQMHEATPPLSGDVLLVEDNEMVQQLIKTFLVKMGLNVTVAENGVVALNLAQQHDYDLIYMDMQMPVMSGVDAVKALRDKNYAGPIVMLTANATLADRNLCKEVGSNDFLTKPVNRQQLYETTKKILIQFS
ncbi:MAG: response regulator [Gammaproteobacteria bacterium]|jgi:signal transduction histidine kinase/CheY-like chemotaxis protein